MTNCLTNYNHQSGPQTRRDAQAPQKPGMADTPPCIEPLLSGSTPRSARYELSQCCISIAILVGSLIPRPARRDLLHHLRYYGLGRKCLQTAGSHYYAGSNL